MTMQKNNNSSGVKVDSVKKITELYDFMREQNLEELELSDSSFSVRLRRRTKRTARPQVQQVHAGDVAQAAEAARGTPVKSPLNGIFYRAASPQSPPFVNEGDIAEKGAVLCIVEAMKVMNEIRAEKRCRILKILKENGEPVNTEQDMFSVEPA
jgi:acetyl-CoA carboxylase biotin carboxyl carrier protein